MTGRGYDRQREPRVAVGAAPVWGGLDPDRSFGLGNPRAPLMESISLGGRPRAGAPREKVPVSPRQAGWSLLVIGMAFAYWRPIAFGILADVYLAHEKTLG